MSGSRITPWIYSGIFIAFVIIFTHIFALQTPFIRISFGFLPTAIFAFRFGPLRTAVMAGTADIIGCLIFSPALFFPGFTFSAALSGFIYGCFFYQKDITWQRSLMACGLIFFLVDLGLNTLWLSLLYQKAASFFFLSRLFKSTLLFPLQIALLSLVFKPLKHFLPAPPNH